MRVFVIRGFGVKNDSLGRPIDFESVHRLLIAPALAECGLAGGTTGEIVEAGNIRADMFALILEADLVVCDITVHNANVFYELGVRHALRKRHTILLKGSPSDASPFDLLTDRYLSYPLADPAQALPNLLAMLRASLNGNRETDSPVFQLLPMLQQADPAQIVALPLDFVEEVERAEAAGDKGWLRVIAEDLHDRRFRWQGLRLVARAQWRLKDISGGIESWYAVREANGSDIEANLALANLYERQYREVRREDLLEFSNQTVRRVLQVGQISLAHRAEALALHGRNLKTLWRTRFHEASDPAASLAQALDARAWQCYESYCDAFNCDLNAFYPGLAALQMGHILLKASALSGWRGMFGGDERQAQRAADDLPGDLARLTQVVNASIKRALEQAKTNGGDRLWATIAAADLFFLTEAEEGPITDASFVVQAYKNAVPENNSFARDAVIGQLKLFVKFGIRAAAAEAVIAALGAGKQAVAEHLVVFAGHNIDSEGARPRFPAASESRARVMIAAGLQSIRDKVAPGERLTVLASAAPGADLLAHEVCVEMGVACRLCLPIPAVAVARDVFPDADGWRTRFWQIVNAHEAEILQLSDDPMPRWLQDRPGIDRWERGNRWVMHLAQTWGARRVTLLALWDGVDDDSKGGTAHMVRLARSNGQFHLEIIDSKTLISSPRPAQHSPDLS